MGALLIISKSATTTTFTGLILAEILQAYHNTAQTVAIITKHLAEIITTIMTIIMAIITAIITAIMVMETAPIMHIGNAAKTMFIGTTRAE